MPPSETFYERLGVDPAASEAEVERAYRERAKRCHPDVSDHPDARERFRRLNRAREVLTDPAERARYDRLGHATYRRREGHGPGSGSGSGTGTSGHEEEDSSPQRERDSATHGEREANETERTADTGAPPGGPSAPSAGAASSDPRGRLGRFALGEAVAAGALAALGGGLLWLVVHVAGRPAVGDHTALAAVLVGWVPLALVAGHLAGRWHGALPDDVVRAQAFPLVLLVVAWYAGRLGGSDAVVGSLAAYGTFAALFRTVALVAAPDGRTLRAAAVWFVGTAPLALVGYVGSAGAGSVGRRLPVATDATLPAGLGVEAVVVAAPALVVLGHVVWRSWRALR